MRAPISLRSCGLILMVLCILWIPSKVSSSENKVTPIYDPRDIEQRFEDWLARYGREYETNGAGCENSTELPAAVDWRKKGAVTPIKDQGQCVAAVEGINKIKTGKLVSLSEQELMECDVSSDTQGCEGGDMKITFQYIKKIGGITTKNDYPYKGKDGTFAQQPVSVAIDAGNFEFQLYSSGIFSGSCADQLNHGVAAAGCGESRGREYWLVKNSWGRDWGESATLG
ncbi:hypothetical protein H0E87_022722 [Populus deltoides]|uniref:Peptidase C1A papain C-terminal domain-containing protein n=1 Tax=Populus deltoides TaxID=3696 RepID=A0A8T2XD28_POPDE|nr:hypothetical protein H0E87_022722 [Populus deltoides]